MIPLHPILQFPGLISGILAAFEHGDDDNLHGNGRGPGKRSENE